MIESKVSDTILEEKFTYEICGESYEVSPPSCGTIIEMSKLVSELPVIDIGEETQVISVVLKHAKDCGNILAVAALLILGYNGKKGKRDKKFLFFKWKEQYDKYTYLQDKLKALPPKKIESIIGEILIKSEIDVFFYITTSLKEANILKATKTTAFGV